MDALSNTAIYSPDAGLGNPSGIDPSILAMLLSGTQQPQGAPRPAAGSPGTLPGLLSSNPSSGTAPLSLTPAPAYAPTPPTTPAGSSTTTTSGAGGDGTAQTIQTIMTIAQIAAMFA